MSMGVCSQCQRFTSVNENRKCGKCIQENSKMFPRAVKLTEVDSKIMLENYSSGKILTKEEWFYVKRRIDKFYSYTSSDDIDYMNRQRSVNNSIRAEKQGYVYLMLASNGYYKIGRGYDVEKRREGHQRDYPLQMDIVHSFLCKDCVSAETKLLRMFKEKRLQGEWFSLDKSDVDFILGITDDIAQMLF